MVTRVVNAKQQKYDVNIGRPGIFGNPFIIGRDGDRGGVVGKHRDYFYARLEHDAGFKIAVEQLRGKVLGCPGNCKPLACHGDVVAEYLNANLA